MSRNIVFEGWLTKSPPTRRIWKAKWRRRWFALRQSGELPGQYFLDYYADRNCRRLKGTINLDLCEQVDAGLHMERGNGTLNPKVRGSVFTVRTQSRTYHLEADCETEMEQWVEAICRVCGLRVSEDPTEVIGNYQNSLGNMSVANEQYECSDEPQVYIPISECITGVRVQQDMQRAFTFDPKNIMTSSRTRTYDKAPGSRSHQLYTSQPHIRLNAEFSENESNQSEDDCKSLTASHSNIGDWSVAKSFTKIAISPKNNGLPEDGPPLPPRPPKPFQGPRMQEPGEAAGESQPALGPSSPWLRLPRRRSQGASPSSLRRHMSFGASSTRLSDDDDETACAQPSMQYCNLSSLPPAVDRALKPRFTTRNVEHSISNLFTGQLTSPHATHNDDVKAAILQYLDLDLQASKPTSSKSGDANKGRNIVHGKSHSAADSDTSDYKTVDFLKTEAFNITRQDAEASRNTQH